ncbi:MAG: hypothetical protein N3B12_07305 [Armatimonadetes bacterium]|nr:hypothetical protein [Armatimonadota bacterium]
MDVFIKLSIVATFCAVGLALSATAAEDLLAGFSPKNKDAQLMWVAPAAGPTCEVIDGDLLVAIPQTEKGYNHWVDGVADSPMLKASAPGGDWNISAQIELKDFSSDSNFHVGLVVGFADTFVMTFGPFQGPSVWPQGKWPEIWIEATGMAGLVKTQADGRSVYLQIRKSGNKYACYYRNSASDEWKISGEYLGAFPPKFVGVIGRTFGSGSGISFAVRELNIQSAKPWQRQSAEITIDASKIVGRIDRNIYGHFIEHLERCIHEGIWAEMLWNRKFTGGIDENGVIESWSRFGEGATYARDNVEFYTSCQSQRIELAPGKEAGIIKKNASLGIKQQKYVARAVLKQKGLSSPITIALRQGDMVYASASIPEVSSEWKEYKVELDPIIPQKNQGKAADPDAQFSVSAVGPGTLWVGCLSLMPADNVEGMRRDVLEAIKRIRPPLIRWPGGNMASGYHWEDGIGNRDKRMPRWERAWNNWEWNDFGTDEYIRFCKLVGTEPYICVNAGEGQADEAARWVEYCNGSPDTPYGRLRAANGHPEPYKVKYWGIGNEMYGDWQLGHLDATKYALKSIEFARAMKAVDPSILLIGVGVPYDDYGKWNSTVSKVAGSYYDYISVHYYKSPRPNDPPELTYLELIGASLDAEKMLADTADVVDANSPKKLPLALDEWNIWLPDGLKRSMFALRDGLFAASVLNAMQRLSDRVTMANLAQLVNVLGAIQTSMTELVETPIYKVFELYSNLCRENRVAADATCDAFDTPAGRMPVLDVSATLSDDRRTLVISVVNRDPLLDHPAIVKLSGFSPAPKADLAVLSGADVFSTNEFGKAEQVKIARSKLLLNLSKEHVFPAHSVTFIVLQSR